MINSDANTPAREVATAHLAAGCWKLGCRVPPLEWWPTHLIDQLGEDKELQEALERGGENEEAIRAQVVLSAEDRSTLKESIADPQQTFVSNTTCASCHRLVDTRFDFHSFSYLEDHEATISPRVEADTENDLARFADHIVSSYGKAA